MLNLDEHKKQTYNFRNKPWSRRGWGGWDSSLTIVFEVDCAMCGWLWLVDDVPMTWERAETMVDKSVSGHQLELDS